MWLRDRSFLEYPFATPRCRGGERRQLLWVCPVYASSFAQSNREKRTVAGIQASGGPEKELRLLSPCTVWKERGGGVGLSGTVVRR